MSENEVSADSVAHCPTCVCGRRAPVQAGGHPRRGAGNISWWEHEQAWAAYGALYSGQDAERIAQRGGFSYGELQDFLGHDPTAWSARTPSASGEPEAGR